MSILFKKVNYENLNSRQQESYNFQKLSGVLASYGFATIRLSDDWNGADFLAQHHSGNTLRIQLKSRLSFRRSYKGKGLWIAFRVSEQWYLFPHDEILEHVLQMTNVGKTVSWRKHGGYSFPTVPRQLQATLDAYRL